jgi:hypothetical protein
MNAVNDERAEKALRYLLDTDEKAAELKSDMERLEHMAKSMRDTAFQHLQGSVADRTAAANVAPDVQRAWGEYFAAVRACNAVVNKRRTEELVIDCWRSVNSNRRAGL